MTLSRHLSALDGASFSCRFQMVTHFTEAERHRLGAQVAINWQCSRVRASAGHMGFEAAVEYLDKHISTWLLVLKSNVLFVVDTISQERGCPSHSNSKSKAFLGINSWLVKLIMKGLYKIYEPPLHRRTKK